MAILLKVTYRSKDPNANTRGQVAELKDNIRVLRVVARGKMDRLSQRDLDKYGKISKREAKTLLEAARKTLRQLTGNTWAAYFKIQNRMQMRRMGPYFNGIIGYDDRIELESEDNK